MADPRNLAVMREGVIGFAARGLQLLSVGGPLPRIRLDFASLPFEIHLHQPKVISKDHHNARTYPALVTSIAETGDMLDTRLRPGNVGTADGALDGVLDVVDRGQAADLCEVAMVRMNAGFPSAGLLAGFDA